MTRVVTKDCWLSSVGSSSPEWDKIDKNDRQKVGLTFEEDGEFW